MDFSSTGFSGVFHGFHRIEVLENYGEGEVDGTMYAYIVERCNQPTNYISFLSSNVAHTHTKFFPFSIQLRLHRIENVAY